MLYSEYVDFLKSEKKSEKTIKTYTFGLNIFCNWKWNKDFQNTNAEDFEELTKKDIRLYKDHLQDKENKALTIKSRLDSIISLFDFLVESEYVHEDDSIGDDIRVIKARIKTERNKKRTPLTLEDMQIIFNAIKEVGGSFKNRRILMFHLMSYYGMRREELCDLKLTDFDFKNDTLNVIGKGNKWRGLPLYPITRQLLENYLCDRENFSHAAEHVFCSRKSSKMDVSSISKDFKVIIDKIELNKRIHPHKLRAFFATQLYIDGIDVKTIQDLMGHSSISTTQRYMSKSNEKMREAMNNNSLNNIAI